MKKIVLLFMIVIPGALFSQVKPSLIKAETALKAGKLDEAKTIIDVTVESQEFMVDKKGAPTKNAGKAWFVKGCVYAALDSSKNPAYHSLTTDGFVVAKECFDKAETLRKEEDYVVIDKNGIPMMGKNVKQYFAQSYFNQAIAAYTDKKDYKRAFELTEQTLYFIPEDSAVVMNAGVYFGPSANEDDKSIMYIEKYFKMGGKQIDAYIQLFSIYRDKKKDNAGALKVVRDAMVIYPKNADFPKYELDLLIKMDRLPEAKTAMEKQVAANPNDRESAYFLGVINMELKNGDEAKKWYGEAIKIDPNYLEPRLALAEIIFQDSKDIKVQMNHLGITADDKKKRYELDKVYVEKLKAVLPYWQACEKLAPDDARVLDILLGIYTDLDMQPELTKLTKHMKTLGLLD